MSSRYFTPIALATALGANCTVAGLSDGLVAHYSFSGNANDASGNSNHGIITAAVPATDRFGNGNSCYSFDGDDDYITVPDSDTMDLNSFTIAAWLRLSGTPGAIGWVVIAKGADTSEDAAHNINYSLEIHSDRRALISYEGATTSEAQASGVTALPVNDWCFVVATRESVSGKLTVYLNGAQDGQTTSALVPNVQNQATVIAAYHNGSSYVNDYYGSIDDIRIYNRALSAAEVVQLYAVGKSLSSVLLSGPSNITEGGTASFTCTAQFSDGSSADVSTQSNCGWSIVGNRPVGTEFAANTLLAGAVSASTPISIKATYSSPGETRSATKTVTIQPKFEVSIETTAPVFNHTTGKWDIDLLAPVLSPYGLVTTYAWDLDGDGVKDDASIQNPVLHLMPGATMLVGLTCTDESSNTADAWRYVTVGKEPIAGQPIVPPTVDVLNHNFLNSTGGVFTFDPLRRTNGLIIITHGLYGAATNDWVTNMARHIELKLTSALPNVVLFNWSEMSSPDKYTGVGNPDRNGFEPDDWWAIRKYGIAQGHVVADWIQNNIQAGNIVTYKPIHFIGHSAGGHVAESCAIAIGTNVTQISTLDTPAHMSESQLGSYINKGGRAEQYNRAYGTESEGLTNQYPQRVYAEHLLNRYGGPGWIAGHSWVHDWYTNTIADTTMQNGFYYSPFMKNGFHGYAAIPFRLQPNLRAATIAITPIVAFGTFGTVTNDGEIYTVTEVADAGLSKSVALPVGALNLVFRYRFTSPGDGDFLTVHVGTNEAAYIGLDLPLSRSNNINGSVEISEFANQTNVLTIMLNSRSNANAVLAIDSIGIEVSDDPDNDGMINDQEASLGTDPLKADTDGDGISDGDEVNTYHTNPLNPDSDNDGISDGTELRSGTSPTNILDRLAITDIGTAGRDGPTIKWLSVNGKTYRVNRWTNLVEDSYTTVTNAVSATAPTTTFTDSMATNGPMFYWIQLDE